MTTMVPIRIGIDEGTPGGDQSAIGIYMGDTLIVFQDQMDAEKLGRMLLNAGAEIVATYCRPDEQLAPPPGNTLLLSHEENDDVDVD